jgi:putative membrane protein
MVLDAGQDQHLGGVIMLLVGAVVFLAGGLVLVGRLLADSKAADSSAGPAGSRG